MMNENQTPPQQLSSIQSWDQLREFIASVSEQMKETDRRLQETDRIVKETAEKGLFVIRVSDNNVFTLDAAKKEDRMYF